MIYGVLGTSSVEPALLATPVILMEGKGKTAGALGGSVSLGKLGFVERGAILGMEKHHLALVMAVQGDLLCCFLRPRFASPVFALKLPTYETFLSRRAKPLISTLKYGLLSTGNRYCATVISGTSFSSRTAYC